MKNASNQCSHPSIYTWKFINFHLSHFFGRANKTMLSTFSNNPSRLPRRFHNKLCDNWWPARLSGISCVGGEYPNNGQQTIENLRFYCIAPSFVRNGRIMARFRCSRLENCVSLISETSQHLQPNSTPRHVLLKQLPATPPPTHTNTHVKRNLRTSLPLAVLGVRVSEQQDLSGNEA